jgi:hypothetical protein
MSDDSASIVKFLKSSNAAQYQDQQGELLT